MVCEDVSCTYVGHIKYIDSVSRFGPRDSVAYGRTVRRRDIVAPVGVSLHQRVRFKHLGLFQVMVGHERRAQRAVCGGVGVAQEVDPPRGAVKHSRIAPRHEDIVHKPHVLTLHRHEFVQIDVLAADEGVEIDADVEPVFTWRVVRYHVRKVFLNE